MRTLPILSVCVLPFVLACSETQAVVVKPAAIGERSLAEKVARLENFVRFGVPLFACRPEVRELVANIRSTCGLDAGAASPPAAFGEAASTENTVQERVKKTCTSTDLRGPFAKLKLQVGKTPIGQAVLSLIPDHVVVYMSQVNEVLARNRDTQLKELAGHYRFPGTRFAVVASHVKYGKPDAERRARVVKNALVHSGIPEDVVEEPWIFDLKLKESPPTSRADQPGPGEDHDLDRAVVILRTDCSL